MQPSVNTPRGGSRSWVYASLTVVDGERRLKPSHVSGDRIRFPQPPRLASSKIEIILVNGEEEQRSWAMVLPHDADAMWIPIRIVAE
jgi:hypothetical protein